MTKKNYILIGIIIIFIVALIVYLYLGYKRVEENSDPIINALDTVKSRIIDVDWSSYKTEDITLEKSLTITTEGIFHLTGEIKNGYIRINTKGKVKLLLDNAKITNSIGPAIYIDNAKRVEIELVDDSVNTLTDSKVFTGTDADACIFSNDDLVITGSGTLNINGNHALGIHTKKDLKINSGNINIDSVDDGICGKDSIEVVNGNINIDTKKNGLKSSNIKDYDKGFIIIRDGNLNLNSRLDGIQAESILFIEKGNINIKTTGNPKEKENGNLISTKGLKGESVVVNGGNITIEATDDAIHANDYVLISNVNCTIKSGDDGIHADKKITIESGVITINESYEGLEANEIILNKGDIEINASDDGINAASSDDESKDEFHDAPKKGKNKGNSILEINGGNIKVSALGDGIDVNGIITMNDGSLIVEGPQDNANAAIDYDNEFVINGGELIAIGYNGMAQGVSNKSKQVGVLINTDEYYDSKIIIKDSKGKNILSYTPTKNYNSILVSSPKINIDSEISLYVDKKKIETIKIDKVDMSVGENRGGMDFHRPGFDGRR